MKNFKTVHKRTSLLYRKGKQRLRPLTIKQLQEKLETAQSGTLKDQIRREIVRKEKLGIVYNAPVVEEAEA
jgi:hypothetical protein